MNRTGFIFSCLFFTGCSSVIYGTSGVSAYIPLDRNPGRHSNILVSKTDYLLPLPQQAEYVVLVEHVEAASNLNADSDYTTPTESIASATLLEVNQPQVLGALTIYPDSTYSYRLTNGLLQAQLVELIQHHPSVTNVIWKARNSFMWEKEFNVFGNSIDEIINRVVTPYGLVVDIYENEVAVVEELRK